MTTPNIKALAEKSPIEQARALIAELVEFKAKQKTLTGETQSHLFSDLFARLVVSQQELTAYAESLERVNKAAREFKAAWDKDVNFETLLAKDKLFQEIENAGE